ncbi:MAG: type 4a pilus biogenesis protein PilO [Vibrionaceae bacterium]
MANSEQKWDYNEISEWPAATQNIILSLLAAVIVIATYFFVLAPLQDHIAQSAAETHSLEEQAAIKSKRILREGSLQEQEALIKQAQELLAANVPREDDLANLLDEIGQIGQKNNLLFKQLNWSDGKVYDWLYQQTLQIDLQGNFYGIGYFCAQIAQLGRLISLQDFVLEKVKSNQADPLNDKLRLFITAHTYREPKPSEISQSKVKK